MLQRELSEMTYWVVHLIEQLLSLLHCKVGEALKHRRVSPTEYVLAGGPPAKATTFRYNELWHLFILSLQQLVLGERTDICPLAAEHTHTSSDENAVLSTLLLFYFHLIIISLLTGTSLPPECRLLLKVKGPLTHHHSSCIYSHIWVMKVHSENWEADWSKKPSLPGCL